MADATDRIGAAVKFHQGFGHFFLPEELAFSAALKVFIETERMHIHR